MKVNAHSPNTSKQPAAPPKLSKEDIAAKINAKFGKSAEIKKVIPKVEDKVELNSKGVVHSGEEEFGDVEKNDPNAEVTQEKLKSILKNGGFSFNDKERRTLSQILK